jgi:hypothetical protein
MLGASKGNQVDTSGNPPLQRLVSGAGRRPCSFRQQIGPQEQLYGREQSRDFGTLYLSNCWYGNVTIDLPPPSPDVLPAVTIDLQSPASCKTRRNDLPTKH